MLFFVYHLGNLLASIYRIYVDVYDNGEMSIGMYSTIG